MMQASKLGKQLESLDDGESIGLKTSLPDIVCFITFRIALSQHIEVSSDSGER